MNEKASKESIKELLAAAGFMVDWDAVKQAVETIKEAMAALGFTVQEAMKALSQTYEELTECAFEVINKDRWRRFEQRDRARAIEQRYRAEIHRLERNRFYRRIYKPP